MFKLLALLLLFITGCRNYDYKDSGLSTEQREQLQQRYDSILPWAIRCDGGVAKEGCSVGDTALFNGIACASGDEEACDAVRRSQGEDGKVWRAPSRVGVDTENSSSRDMALGFMLYLSKTKDRQAALKFQDYIESHKKLCEDATDNKCNLTPVIWGIMYHVWGHLGLVRSSSMEINSYGLEQVIEGQFAFTGPGYQLHLLAVEMFILKEVGYHNNTLVHVALKMASFQTNNPFFQYVAGDLEKATNLILQQAPIEQPLERSQWSFERDTKEEAWKDSMGHEFLSLIRLILR